MTRKSSYLYALLLAVLTVIVCLAIADGMIGVAGTIRNYEGDPDGHHTFTLHVKDPTGDIIFWLGMLILPALFSGKVALRHTWICLPVYIVSWYLLSLIFGEMPNHQFLAHPSGGFISMGEELHPFLTALYFWILQMIVLAFAKAVRALLRRIKQAQKSA